MGYKLMPTKQYNRLKVNKDGNPILSQKQVDMIVNTEIEKAREIRQQTENLKKTVLSMGIEYSEFERYIKGEMSEDETTAFELRLENIKDGKQ